MNKRVKRGRMVLLGSGYLEFDIRYEGQVFTVGVMEYSDPDRILKSDFRPMRGLRHEFKKVRLYAEIIPQGRKKK